ncbi:MAG TPA: acyl carrier protein, partial [Deltaproteobacteria bacterium]|nr:acyl carrier protein [Deltaproteobacteria bacterium]
MSTEKKIKQIIAEQLGLNEDELSNKASLLDDLGADSL